MVKSISVLILSLAAWVTASTSLAAQATSPIEPNDGTVGHAVLGGLAGGYGGLILGTVASRVTCRPREDCSPIPSALLAAAGITVGSYAGMTDRNRAYGGMIGTGVGVLSGALIYGIWASVRSDHPDPFTALGAAIVAGGVGAIVGTAVSGSGEGDFAAVDPAPRRAIAIPVRVAF